MSIRKISRSIISLCLAYLTGKMSCQYPSSLTFLMFSQVERCYLFSGDISYCLLFSSVTMHLPSSIKRWASWIWAYYCFVSIRVEQRVAENLCLHICNINEHLVLVSLVDLSFSMSPGLAGRLSSLQGVSLALTAHKNLLCIFLPFFFF